MVAKSKKRKRNRVYEFKYTDGERLAARAWYNLWARYGGATTRHEERPTPDIDESWRTLEVFLEDMGEKPKGAYLCRRNRFAPYSPENCYWGKSRQYQCPNKLYNMNSEKAQRAALMLLQGYAVREVSQKLNVTMASIYQISAGRSWKREMHQAKMQHLGII